MSPARKKREWQQINALVTQWQAFLCEAGYAVTVEGQPATLDGSDQIPGYFGPETQEATLKFQEAEVLEEIDGVVGPLTLAAAARHGLHMVASDGKAWQPTAGKELQREFAQIGPNRDDLRECRPFFVVPLLDLVSLPYLANLRRRIRRYVGQITGVSGPVTDVFILSHGWHRNFFGAIDAYDRLMSRFSTLWRRDRLNIPTAGKLVPLFITLHWHSDPGENSWVDQKGRRDKDSFIEAARTVFEPRRDMTRTEREVLHSDFLNLFEDIFELFVYISAPGTAALSGKYLRSARTLLQRLDRYDIVDSKEPARVQEKATTAWTCYHEAQTSAVLVDQTDRPSRFNNIFQALWTLGKFFVAVFGPITLLLYLIKRYVALNGTLWQDIAGGIIEFGGAIARLLHLGIGSEDLIRIHIVDFGNLEAQKVPLLSWQVKWELGLLGMLGILLTGLLIQGGTVLYADLVRKRKQEPSEGAPTWLAVLGWLPVQLVFSLPIVVVSIVTYLLGGLIAGLCAVLPLPGYYHQIPGLFDERVGRRNVSFTPDDEHKAGEAHEHSSHVFSTRYLLAIPARWPILWLRRAVAPDSKILNIAAAIDNQMAFWMMQKRGVDAGEQAADFIADLFEECPELHGARVHLIGHSFGGLVVCNLARHLALDTDLQAKMGVDPVTQKPKAIHSLCLLEGALGSAWFEGETKLREYVQGPIASVYSGYDTANGFYYPFANSARVAAGYVGLYGTEFKTGGQTLVPAGGDRDNLFAMLVHPPNLSVPANWNRVINMDASRLIYAGSPASGGGHDDIFKDDVVYLLWSISRLGIPSTLADVATHPTPLPAPGAVPVTLTAAEPPKE